MERQEADWRRKFDSLRVDNEQLQLSYDEFKWGMEVVYSRAFRGGSVTNAGLTKTSILQVACLAVGLFDVTSLPTSLPADLLLGACSLSAVAPLITNLLSNDEKDTSACLLPVIDSCNHTSGANSKICYDVLSKKFSLSVGGDDTCVRKSLEGKNELVISYGKRRTKQDLLLNYGFVEEELKQEINNEEQWRAAVANLM